MHRKQMIRLSALMVSAIATLAQPAFAQDAWQDRKCALYEAAWERALESLGDADMNYNFVATNENFIASGCAENIKACPRSDQELEVANLLTLVMMNEGVASTFLPFGCPSQ
jgi:hypothetical protein